MAWRDLVKTPCGEARQGSERNMSYSLNSSKEGYIREYIGEYCRGYKGGY